MDDVDQSLINELALLDRAIANRKKRIAESVKRASYAQPRRYVVDIPIAQDDNLVVTAGTMPPVSRQVVVDKSCKLFLCTEIAATVMAVGTLTDTSVAAKIALAAFSRAMSYEWQVRDTYHDASWQSSFMPDLALASGKNGGMRLARPMPLPPGTIIETTVQPLQTIDDVSVLVTDVSEYQVQFSFIGEEFYE